MIWVTPRRYTAAWQNEEWLFFWPRRHFERQSLFVIVKTTLTGCLVHSEENHLAQRLRGEPAGNEHSRETCELILTLLYFHLRIPCTCIRAESSQTVCKNQVGCQLEKPMSLCLIQSFSEGSVIGQESWIFQAAQMTITGDPWTVFQQWTLSNIEVGCVDKQDKTKQKPTKLCFWANIKW